jgi:hypothetical protein
MFMSINVLDIEELRQEIYENMRVKDIRKVAQLKLSEIIRDDQANTNAKVAQTLARLHDTQH